MGELLALRDKDYTADVLAHQLADESSKLSGLIVVIFRKDGSFTPYYAEVNPAQIALAALQLGEVAKDQSGITSTNK